MDTRRWRRRIGGWGLLLVGGAAAAYTVTMWGLGAPLLTAFFGVLAVGGAFVLRGRENVYYYLLPVVGVFALLKATSYYLHYGTTLLTLLFALVGVVSLSKAVQGYRALS
jgi:hypothetical protein